LFRATANAWRLPIEDSHLCRPPKEVKMKLSPIKGKDWVTITGIALLFKHTKNVLETEYLPKKS